MRRPRISLLYRAFAERPLGLPRFVAVLTRAAYAYVGSEIVSIAAGGKEALPTLKVMTANPLRPAEARNPSRSLPQAIRRIIFRIGLFYIAGAFAIGLIVAANDPALSRNDGTALSSPFVVAIERAEIDVRFRCGFLLLSS